LTTFKGLALYFAISIVTLPFVDALWLSDLPLLAIVQVPKLTIAGWLRTDVVMPVTSVLGLSAGSFSPDFIMARPYALALAYLIPVAVLLATGCVGKRMVRPYPLWSCVLLGAAVLDCLLTLRMSATPGLTLY
jgi:hypothetical protein